MRANEGQPKRADRVNIDFLATITTRVSPYCPPNRALSCGISSLSGPGAGNSPFIGSRDICYKLGPSRKGGRAVEGTGLENRQARKGLVGSNPTPSAISLFLDVLDHSTIPHLAREISRILFLVISANSGVRLLFLWVGLWGSAETF